MPEAVPPPVEDHDLDGTPGVAIRESDTGGWDEDFWREHAERVCNLRPERIDELVTEHGVGALVARCTQEPNHYYRRDNS